MTQIERQFGTEPVQIVEIDQDFCALTYGESPCTAAVGVTGNIKCFNTASTCQDRENFDRASLTLRFSKPDMSAGDRYGYVIPSLVSVTTAPSRINIGGRSRDSGALGNRAVLNVVFQDHPHSDHLVDKYREERSFDAYRQGTFWGKWLARNPFYIGRRIRVYEGYAGQTIEEMRVRTYAIETVNGPDTQGHVQITAKDFLKLTDRERAVAPRPTLGETASSVTDTQTTITLENTTEGEYPTGGGTVRIGDEVMTYGSASYEGDGETILSGITRGTDGTEADEHDEFEAVQLCLRYTNEPSYLIAYDLITNFAEVPSEFIDLDAWFNEWDTFLPAFTLTALITEPVGVNDLLGELSRDSTFNIWWDERDQAIPFRAVRVPSGDIVSVTDDANIIRDSVGLRRRGEDRISQVWVYYGIRNPIEAEEEATNYRRRRISADLDAQLPEEYGEPRIFQIFSRWIQTEAQAINVTALLLQQYRDTPLRVTLTLDAKDRDLWLADIVEVTHHNIQTVTGTLDRALYQIISAEETVPSERVEYEVQSFGLAVRIARWMPDGSPVYEDATDEERAEGFFWADGDGLTPDGNQGYAWQ